MVEKIGIEAKQSLAADNSLHMWFNFAESGKYSLPSD